MKQTTKKFRKGFTLVELVIVIAIVIVLSVVSVPIYRSYVDKAILSEGRALMGTILSAQKAYYSEYGNFYRRNKNWYDWTSYDETLGIDARGNKYFTAFTSSHLGTDPTTQFGAHALRPISVIGGKTWLKMTYNITVGLFLTHDSSEEII